MKNFSFLFIGLLCIACQVDKSTELRVLQFNIWHEGRQVEDGFNGIVTQIIASDADVVMLSEINNANNTRFSDRIIEALVQKGYLFHSFYSTDTGILSKYPIKSYREIFNAGNNINKAIVDYNGKELALYSAHLDYLHCSYYLVKGYDGCTWEQLPAPITDIDSILHDAYLSTRDEAIATFLSESTADQEAGRIVILGGDFNEPSHLDWGSDMKNLYDHNGLVIPWHQSTQLSIAGFVDTYREKYPNPVTHPGFTYPAFTPGVAFDKLIWAPEMDERERIDFIYYLPSPHIQLEEVVIWGPNKSVCKSREVKENTADVFRSGNGIWPSDHKALLVKFTVR